MDRRETWKLERMIMESKEFWNVIVKVHPELRCGSVRMKATDVRWLVERAWDEGYAYRTRDSRAAKELMDATLSGASAPFGVRKEVE